MYKTREINDQELLKKYKEIIAKGSINNVFDTLHYLQKHTNIEESLNQNYLMDFDTMIENLNRIKSNLITLFQSKYKCLFVDEFQDTDRNQYEIFKTLFHNNYHTVFYIGDPKQAIYGFRGAEINTYLNAKNDIENVYTLNTNFRSVKALINTLNNVFDNQNTNNGRNPFYFEVTGNEINHSPIQAANDLAFSFIYNNKQIEKSFYILPFLEIKDTAKDIHSLLTHGVNHDQSLILPQQIAFIARGNKDLSIMKQELALLGIPAVIINEDKIFNSEEFNFIKIILNAINNRNQSRILKFLDHKIFNISTEQLLKLDIDPIINHFYEYHLMINDKGIYDTLKQIFIILVLKKTV